ncbi:MAG: hypothetical protein ABSG64_06395 [Solirubrobacteraceae bacterium]
MTAAGYRLGAARGTPTLRPALRRTCLLGCVLALAALPAWPGGAAASGSVAAAFQSSFNGVSCVGGGECVAVGQIALSSSIQPLGEVLRRGRWRPAPVSPIGRDSQLAAISCVSARWCLAVGGRPAGALSEIWDGKRWAVASVPLPHGTNTLAAVSCLSATWCVAVGSTELETPLAERWNGVSWTALATASLPAGGNEALLRAVSCAAPDDCVAAGTSFSAGGEAVLVERYAAGVWRRVQVPPIADTPALSGVSCPTAGWCLAVGTTGAAGSAGAQPLVLRIAGDQVSRLWPASTTPAAAFYGVSCTTIQRCVVVGDTPTSLTAALDTPFAEELDSGAWQTMTIVSGGVSEAFTGGVSCVAVTACNAVGGVTAGQRIEAVSERLVGSTWRPLVMPADPF